MPILTEPSPSRCFYNIVVNLSVAEIVLADESQNEPAYYEPLEFFHRQVDDVLPIVVAHAEFVKVQQLLLVEGELFVLWYFVALAHNY